MPKQKQIEVTEDMLAQIERVTGTSVSADDIVVYEAVVASTRPISKLGSFYDKSVMSLSLLQDMADAVNTGRENVPLHTLHMQGSELPIGRVFQARVDGDSLTAHFYIPRSERDIIEKINLAVLDEVSVGMKSNQALCSKCGFDYFGENAGFEYLWMQTCDQGHTIGVDGAHIKLTGGLDSWMELSLVSRGAADKPKILSRAKDFAIDRIAADGIPVQALVLYTATAMETVEMADEQPAGEIQEEAQTPAETKAEPTFDVAKAFDELKDLIREVVTPAPVEAAEEPDPALLEAQAQIEALTAQVEELKTKNPPAAVPVQGVAASAVTDANRDFKGRPASVFKTKR